MNFELKIWDENSPEFSKVDILKSASMAHNISVQTEDWFDWKYLKSPFGKSLIVYAKETEVNSLAGVLIFGLYQHYIDGEKFKSALSYETFVMPEFRGNRLFIKLIDFAIEELNKLEVNFIFNFPNISSLPGFVKTGWMSKNMVTYFIKPQISFKLLTNFLDMKKPFIEDKDNNKPNVISYFNQYSSPKGEGLIVGNRTLKYLKWRYNGESCTSYFIVNTDYGKALFRKGKRGSLIEVQLLDFNVKKENYSKFFRYLSKRLREEHKYDILGISLSKEHLGISSIKNTGYIEVPTQTNFAYYVINKNLNYKLDSYKWIFTANEFHTY